jgi:nucleoside-diphosphate-sugar epimerase
MISAVDLPKTNPRLTFEVNIVGTYNLLAAAVDLVPAPRILNVSTA